MPFCKGFKAKEILKFFSGKDDVIFYLRNEYFRRSILKHAIFWRGFQVTFRKDNIGYLYHLPQMFVHEPILKIGDTHRRINTTIDQVVDVSRPVEPPLVDNLF